MTDVLMIDDLLRSLDRFGIKAGIDPDGAPADGVSAQPDMIHPAGPVHGGACPAVSPAAGCCPCRAPAPTPTSHQMTAACRTLMASAYLTGLAQCRGIGHFAPFRRP
jgi:hypothetical protein